MLLGGGALGGFYTVTEFGMTLVAALMPLCAWGTANRARIEQGIAEDHPER